MLSEPEPIALINATHDVLADELGHLERSIPEEMTRALDENIFLFSGFKTYHEMNDASRLLKDDDGGFKPFHRFLQDVQAIDASYNQNWLYAEYNFATASTQMAAKWADIERDDDEYDLQYRTASDGLVREEHAALEGITLPPSDKFWDQYFPPNGWNCRCTAVQVLKDKYPESDSDQACAAGERATTQIDKNGNNKAEMFRFNPGKSGKVFPPKHPYFKAPAEAKKKVNAIIATMIVRDDYETVPTEKGKVRIHKLHGINETEENKRISTYLANKYGYHIDLLPQAPGGDSYNITMQRNEEYKASRTNTKSSIDNLLKKANRQCHYVVIEVSEDIPLETLERGIKGRLSQPSNKIETIRIIMGQKDVEYKTEDILKDDFHIKQKDFT